MCRFFLQDIMHSIFPSCRLFFMGCFSAQYIPFNICSPIYSLQSSILFIFHSHFRTYLVHISFTEVNIYPTQVNYPTFFLENQVI